MNRPLCSKHHVLFQIFNTTILAFAIATRQALATALSTDEADSTTFGTHIRLGIVNRRATVLCRRCRLSGATQPIQGQRHLVRWLLLPEVMLQERLSDRIGQR